MSAHDPKRTFCIRFAVERRGVEASATDPREEDFRSKVVWSVQEVPMQEYQSAKLVVRYDPAICIHSGECVRGLPSVFNVSKTPWIDVTGASGAAVIEQGK